jgi:hypothetical protein
MAQTNTGLPNGGVTACYAITYESSLAPADGLNRAIALMADCDADFALMQAWFGGITLKYALPLVIQIGAGTYAGANWSSSGPTTLIPGNGTSIITVRYLLVSEVVEMFMDTKGNGWGYSGSDSNEGSKGEGLTRFLGVQFLLAIGLGKAPPAGFGTTTAWLNGLRQNYVDNNPDDNKPDQITGCTTCFIYYLHDQLGFTINQIINAGAATLGGVYTNLTGASDGCT